MVALFLKTYSIIRDAVEDGVSYGIQRAFKYSKKPTEDELQMHIEREVMGALSEVIDYEKYEIHEPEADSSED